MAYDVSKNVELYMLYAENFDENVSPNQKQYYLDAAQWMRENTFESQEQLMEAMKGTEYYEGGGIAKTADDILLRIKAMKEVGYDDVAKVHEERKAKFDSRGNEYAFSGEWIEDYNKVAEVQSKYAERKEVFGKIFQGYIQIVSNPQQEHRKRGADEISKGLKRLEELGVTFDELVTQNAYKKLTMATDKGMENFAAYIKDFVAKGEKYEDDLGNLKEEQNEIARFIGEHRAEIIEAGKSEPWNWKRANCIAVPSDDPTGYDFIEYRYQDIK